jgi:hypothetical protein
MIGAWARASSRRYGRRVRERAAEADVDIQPAPTVAAASPVAVVTRLQATAGNRAVGRLLARQPTVTPQVTAAAYAKTSPQQEYMDILHREVGLLANGRAVAAFLRARAVAASGAPAQFTAADLLADAKLVKQLKPKPTTADDLQPTLDLLAYHGVIAAKGGGSYAPVVDTTTNDLKTAALEQAATDIGKFSASFDQRAALKDSVNPVGVTSLLDPALAAGAASEKQEEQDAGKAVADLEAQLGEFVVLKTPGAGGKARAPITRVTVATLPAPTANKAGVDVVALPVAGQAKPVELPAADVAGIEPVATGTSDQTVALRKALQTKLEKARRRLDRAQGYHTFAIEVADFLDRLATRNKTFVGGTYPRHDWGEFSVDIFLNVGEDTQGFYDLDPAEKFLDAVNDTANEDGPFGKFAWRAVYNDDRMITRIDKKYGARRITKAPHHGPAPDKLHIHLDLRPVDLVPDAVTGFTVNPSGRVQVL